MKRIVSVFVCLICQFGGYYSCLAQRLVELNDLGAFEAAESWKIAEYVSAYPDRPEMVISGAGGGDILINGPGPFQFGRDLVTKEEFGDIDLELEFLMVRGSKSGIVFQGIYEVRLADSWGTQELAADGHGGIVDTRGPRQGVARAPGLWQKLKVSFKSS